MYTDNVEMFICSLINEKMKNSFSLEEIKSKSFVELGFDSLTSVLFLVELEERYNVEFEETYDTVGQVITFIEEGGS